LSTGGLLALHIALVQIETVKLAMVSKRGVALNEELFQNLLARARQGDQAALAELFARSRGFLTDRLRNKGVPGGLVSDAIRDVEDMGRAKFEHFNGGHVGAWMLWVSRIAATIARKVRREVDREPLNENPDLYAHQAPVDLDRLLQVDADFKKALDKLPRAQADVWILRDIQGHSHEDIQKITKYSAKKVRKLLEKARQSIRDWLIAHSLVVDIRHDPACPMRGLHTAIWIELHNYGYHGAERVAVHVHVDKKKIGQHIVNIPVNGTAKVREVSCWIRRTGHQVVEVTWVVGKAQSSKVVAVAS
jgi:DNA-directed RNA polymerase specialized sigma24 family protein